MGNIVLLDELTINKIAAGEVIERPASVIKEMVENSIDAGATSIIIEIRNGGISYIRISDNGKGIAEDDLEMAFERHATSKIRNADDLQIVTSMGFRGEALASVAAISNVELISKTESGETGHKIVVEGGKVLEQSEVGCPTGTTITVRNLFFNTPVRYKFLRKDYTESGYIEDAVTRIALVHPEISIKLINMGKTVIQTSGNGDLKSVIYSIYGKDIAENVLDTKYTYEGITVKGVVGKPEISRSNRAGQVFFVNKRYIKDKTLSSAVAEAFKGLVQMGKFGFVILNIEMSPTKVDVNVHPAKLEVRFENENAVFKAVYQAIKDVLEKENNSEPMKLENYIESQKTIKMPEIKIEKNVEVGAPINTFDILEKLNQMKQDENIQEEDKNIEKEEINYNIEENLKKEIESIQEIKEEKMNYLYNGAINKESAHVEAIKELEKIDEIGKKDAKLVHEKAASLFEQLKERVAEIEQSKKATKETIEDKVQQIEELEKNNKENEIKKDNLNQEKEEVSDITEADIVEKQKAKVADETIVMPTIQVKEEKPEKEKNVAETYIEKNEQNQNPFNGVKEKIDELANNTQVVTADFKEMYLKTFGKMPSGYEEETEKQPEKENNEISAVDIIKDNNISLFDEVEEKKHINYKYIGIAFDTYVVIEIDKELYILDSVSARERIVFEKIKKNYYTVNNKDSQLLLLPDIIQLTSKQMDIAKENMEMFENAGFAVEEFGENTIKLSGVPEMCMELDTKELFIKVINAINTVAITEKKEIEEKFFAQVAQEVASAEKFDLDEENAKRLIDELFELPNPFLQTNKNKTTVIKMARYDIERKFARK